MRGFLGFGRVCVVKSLWQGYLETPVVVARLNAARGQQNQDENEKEPNNSPSSFVALRGPIQWLGTHVSRQMRESEMVLVRDFRNGSTCCQG
jgi:hypothetical protein